MSERVIPCPHCARKFRDEMAVWQHAKAAHPKLKKPPRPLSKYRDRDHPDYEPSFAERAIQAEIDRACGIYNFDQEWLLND